MSERKSKTSAASKNKYNNKAYDRIVLTVPKGQKAKIKAEAETRGLSVNAMIKSFIDKGLIEL